MPLHYPHHSLPVGLLDRSPGQKTCARLVLQDAAEFPQSKANIAEEHHSEAGSGKLKTSVRKRQSLRIRLLRRKILQAALLRPVVGNLQKISTQVERSHMPLRSNSHGDADGRLARTTCQVKYPHPRTRLRILHQRFRDCLAHGRRLRLPLVGRNQPVLASPSRLFFGRSCHRRDPKYYTAMISCDEQPQRLAWVV